MGSVMVRLIAPHELLTKSKVDGSSGYRRASDGARTSERRLPLSMMLWSNDIRHHTTGCPILSHTFVCLG